MSSYSLINAQQLQDYTLFNVSNLDLNPCAQLKGWKEIPKGLKKDQKILAHLICKKHKNYKFIEDLLFEKKLPIQCGYLPLILSGYQSSFVNDNGGSGIWSLNYITALNYGVLMNRNIDERNNDSIATQVAVSEIQRLLNLFKEERWSLLAFITSTNYVTDLKKNNPNLTWEVACETFNNKYFKSIDFIYMLDKMTQNYQEEEAFNNHDTITHFQLNYQLTFDAIYQFFEMDFFEIKKLNPTLINNVFPSKYRLKANNIEANFLKSNQEKIFHFQDSMINDLFFNEDSQKKIIYKVKLGDFLGGIAEKNGVTTANLMNWNTLSSSTIYVGQELKIFSSDKFSDKNFNYYQINKENTFWEIASSLNTHSVLDLLMYNSFHDLKQKKQLRIIKK